MRKNVLFTLVLLVIALAHFSAPVAEATESGPLCDAMITRTDEALTIQIRASEPVDSVYLLDNSDRYEVMVDGIVTLRYDASWWQPAVAQEGVEVIWHGDGFANEHTIVVPLGQEQTITLTGANAPAAEDLAVWVVNEAGWTSNQCNPASDDWPADRVRVARWSWFRVNALSEWLPAATEFQPTDGIRHSAK